MQSWYLLAPISSDGGGGGGLFLPSRKPAALTWPWCRSDGLIRRPGVRAGPVAATANGGDQDHYAVLRLPRSASAADVKRAYRLLARKYHPDVSRDSRTAEVFKSIRLAYEVLSDEVTRAKYDMRLRFPTDVKEPWREKWTYNPESEPWREKWTYNPESNERRRMRRWAEKMRQTMYEKQYRYRRDAHGENSGLERGSFLDVLYFALITLLFVRIAGCRITLAFCCIAACLDIQLDSGYKLGYITAWILGGQAGVFLALCIKFASWLCGKVSSSFIAAVVLSTWIAGSMARFIPLPQGAVLALLYMSIKLQVDLSRA